MDLEMPGLQLHRGDHARKNFQKWQFAAETLGIQEVEYLNCKWIIHRRGRWITLGPRILRVGQALGIGD